jgi:hypothetical protein
MEDQYNDPVHIVAFNTAKGWAQDLTEDCPSSNALRQMAV